MFKMEVKGRGKKGRVSRMGSTLTMPDVTEVMVR